MSEIYIPAEVYHRCTTVQYTVQANPDLNPAKPLVFVFMLDKEELRLKQALGFLLAG
ncbi:hypothetical protein CCACVL1_00883 [Corchorus capsularis]|uniref:Uncharacterized protein n=1 Tax=Corchorus capsularis TaxID=210143 RepID=A0A1R3KTW7_COCAP|nr:hypothetical protein CCACVL1_00883 [Corchorus capsularis]